QFYAAVLLYSAKLGYSSVTMHHETGWIEIDGKRVYRLHGGAYSAEGIRDDVSVELDHAFQYYAVREVPDARTLKDFGRQSLRLLDLASADVVAPMLAAVPLAVLGDFLDTGHTVYAHGRTGSFKTETAVLMTSFFG